MRAKAWWALTVALGGCGGALEEDGVPLHEEPLGTMRQAEASGSPVTRVRFARGEGLQLGSAVMQDRDGNVLTTVRFSGGADEASQGGGAALGAQGEAYFRLGK